MRHTTPVALIVGAGAGLGGAIARRFARGGYHACVVRRTAEPLAPLCTAIREAGGVATAFGVDARKEDALVELCARIERDVGPLAVVVHNVGANVWFPIRETEVRKHTKVWEMAALSGFLVGREAARHMTPRGQGSILFTGATASLRGSAHFASFAGAKHSLRALAQSMARELGSAGIHVAHIVIDGPVDMPWIREHFGAAFADRPADGLLNPDDVAQTYWWLHHQPRSAWTHEIDLRPWVEPW
jgi:NAD(P)-dependent dehydrogenase (short-subunit alcohol dehydrogenase family)